MKKVALALLTGCAISVLVSSISAQEHYDITIEGDHYLIQFDETKGIPLVEFIALCRKITQKPIKYNEVEIQDQKILILGMQKIDRDPKSFFAYFQSVLISYDFICASYGPVDSPYFITVQKLTATGQKATMIQALAPVVLRENLGEYKDNPGMLITTTIPLRYIEARNMLSSLTPLFQHGGPGLESVRNVDNANSLIITGFATKVWGVSKLIELMDVEPFEPELAFRKRELLYAVADELVTVLTDLVQATRNVRPGTPPASSRTGSVLRDPEPKIIAEPRTNSLLFTGSPKVVEQIAGWIDQLDVEVDPRGDIRVYRLKNTLAVEMEEVLSAMIEGQNQTGTSRSAGSTSAVQPGSLDAPAHVVADEASNSLIITASKTKWAQLLEVIKSLDIRRRQVLIEAAMVELTQRLDEALGVELAGLDLKVDADGNLISDNYTRPWGFSSFGLSELDYGDDGIPNQRIPIISTGFTGGIFNGEDFAIPFILSTLQREQKANILQMPSILTNDNEEAMIKATDEQPSFSTSQGEVTSETSFKEYEEAGITLRISPSISAGNYLKLFVEVNMSSFDETSDLNPPPRSTREMTTEVTIPDGHTMIMGGVITDNTTDSRNQVPFLGDLPLIGWLFRSTSKTNRQVNLYVFITPHIIGDDFANLDEISARKKQEVDNLTGKVLLIDPDFEYTNVDARVIDAAANYVFEIPTYAPPETGTVDRGYVEPNKETDDGLGEQ